MEKECKKHGLTEFSDAKRSRCKKCCVEAVSKRRQKIKQMAVEYKGGKCSRCGYNKSLAALHFHHKDPGEKDFGIATGGNTIAWEQVKKEIDKCVLLCANCHAEIHDLEQQGMEVEW